MTASNPTIRETTRPRPLDGFRVLDLTRFLSGPYCTMVLAELGADVIKIEQPHTGDDSRRLAPKINGESYPFAMPNRSKRSVSLDLKTDGGQELFLKMAAEADLVIENFRPGVADRLGIGYDGVKAVRDGHPLLLDQRLRPDRPVPRPARLRHHGPGHGRLPADDRRARGRPAKVGIAINDIAAGATAIYSIMAAQMHRQATGEGQYMDISLVDAGLAWSVWESGAYFGAGEVPQPTGTRHRRSTPYQAYRTSDGYVTIGAANDRLWLRLLGALERPEWETDPRFLTLPDRMAHIDELEAEIEAITTTRTTEEWIKIIDEVGVPCGPVLTFDETLNDPHVLARDMVAEVEHPIIGDDADDRSADEVLRPRLHRPRPRALARPAHRRGPARDRRHRRGDRRSCSPTPCSSTPTPTCTTEKD